MMNLGVSKKSWPVHKRIYGNYTALSNTFQIPNTGCERIFSLGVLTTTIAVNVSLIFSLPFVNPFQWSAIECIEKMPASGEYSFDFPYLAHSCTSRKLTQLVK